MWIRPPCLARSSRSAPTPSARRFMRPSQSSIPRGSNRRARLGRRDQ
uniref:Uncharacterized protein n=1 Tax=Arundo donax TaxID=35708 RepID=A0A0A9ARX0_ARUDO